MHVKIIGNTKSVIVNLKTENIKKSYKQEIDPSQKNKKNYTIMWILNSLKEMFFQMPIEDLNISLEINSKEYVTVAVYLEIFQFVNNVISNTNGHLIQFKEYKDCAKNNEGILFYVFENEERLEDFYKHNERLNRANLMFATYPSGWNPVKRQWEETNYNLTVPEFVKIVKEYQVKKIVTINYYFFDDFLYRNYIFIPAVLSYLGVEPIGVDVDPMEYLTDGYMKRRLFHIESGCRYCTTPLLNVKIDEKYGYKNVNYTTVVRHYSINNTKHYELDDDYSIVVTSNSRIEQVRPQLPFILYILEHLSEETTAVDLQIWYHSMRNMLINQMEAYDFVKEDSLRVLLELMYHAFNFLKYEVISNIETNRKFEIFGDEGWRKIFPEHYNRCLNPDEINELDKNNKVLYLLLNHGFTYLEPSGIILDSIGKNNVFINCPVLVKTEALNGFKHLEYNNKEQLNFLIENINAVYKNEELLNSIEFLKKMNCEEEKAVAKQIMQNVEFPVDDHTYAKQYKEHEVLLNKMIEEYTSKNKDFLMECYKLIFKDGTLDYDCSNSRYYNRKYFRRLLDL